MGSEMDSKSFLDMMSRIEEILEQSKEKEIT